MSTIAFKVGLTIALIYYAGWFLLYQDHPHSKSKLLVTTILIGISISSLWY